MYFIYFIIQDQYFFVHEAIAEAITCGVTEVKLDKFPPYLDKLELIQDDGESSLLETEFKVTERGKLLSEYVYMS